MALFKKGSGCGSVGSVFAPDTRGLRFEYTHRPKFKLNICILTTVPTEKTKINGESIFLLPYVEETYLWTLLFSLTSIS